MPVLVPEDGTGLANANSYASIAEADDYFITHPYFAADWDALGTPDKTASLIQATMVLDSLVIWRGTINGLTQSLMWPRTGVYDDESRLLSSSQVPLRVKWATAELAMHLRKTNPFEAGAAQSQGLEELEIDVIRLKFASSTSKAPVPVPALLLLRGLGEYALRRRVSRVLVG